MTSTSLTYPKIETLFDRGSVAKTRVPLYDRRGDRVMRKLKAKDWKAGKR